MKKTKFIAVVMMAITVMLCFSGCDFGNNEPIEITKENFFDYITYGEYVCSPKNTRVSMKHEGPKSSGGIVYQFGSFTYDIDYDFFLDLEPTDEFKNYYFENVTVEIRYTVQLGSSGKKLTKNVTKTVKLDEHGTAHVRDSEYCNIKETFPATSNVVSIDYDTERNIKVIDGRIFRRKP